MNKEEARNTYWIGCPLCSYQATTLHQVDKHIRREHPGYPIAIIKKGFVAPGESFC